MNEHEIDELRVQHKPASQLKMPAHVKDKIYKMIDENQGLEAKRTSTHRYRSYWTSTGAAVAAISIVVAGIAYGFGHNRITTASPTPRPTQNNASSPQLQSVSYTSNQLHVIETVASNIGMTTPYILTKNFSSNLKKVSFTVDPRVMTVDYGNVRLYEGASVSSLKAAISNQHDTTFADGNYVDLSGGLSGQWLIETVSGQSLLLLVLKMNNLYVAIVPSSSTSTLPTRMQMGTMAQSLVDATAYLQTGISKGPTSFAAVNMVNSVSGWATGSGAIWRSVDKGKTWSDVTPQGLSHVSGQLDLYGLDRDTAWITIHKSGANSTTVYRTADGGQSWMETKIPHSGQPVQLHFANQSLGWIMLYQGVAAGSQQVTIYQTTNGGFTWRQVPSPPGAGDTTGVSFITAKKGFATGAFGLKDQVLLYETSDAGQTWSRVDVQPPSGMSGQSFMTDTPTFFGSKDGVMFVHQETGPLIIYHTSDGGNSWTPTTPVTPKLVNGQMTHFTFASPDDGFATDGTRLYVTTDGGHAWNIISPTGAFANVTSIEFTSAQDGWAVSANGKLSYTTDGGHTWQ